MTLEIILSVGQRGQKGPNKSNMSNVILLVIQADRVFPKKEIDYFQQSNEVHNLVFQFYFVSFKCIWQVVMVSRCT